MPCGATQDGRVMMERSDRMWSSAEGNGKPRQYSRLENPVNSILIIYWLFFISSTSLLNISCIISILASRLFLCNSIFFSIFCVIFAIIIQNSLSGRFHISPSFVSWAFILFLYLLGISVFSCLCCCVWGGPSVFQQFVVPLYCGGSFLWVGLDKWLVKVSWLGKLVSVFWWVELDLLSQSALKCPIVSFEVSVGLLWLLGTCILMLRVLFPQYWRISLVCLALELVSSWVELCFNVGMETFGWALVD